MRLLRPLPRSSSVLLVLLVTSLASIAAAAAVSLPAPLPSAVSTLAFVPGSNLPDAVSKRVQTLLSNVVSLVPVSSNPDLILSCGASPYTRSLITQAEIDGALPETLFVRFSASQSLAPLLAADGASPLPEYSLGVNVSSGAVYACYAALEALGFGFLHPLSPLVPDAAPSLAALQGLNKTESPTWPVRGFHIHSMHPLELTDLLNGLDIDDPPNNYTESWDSMLPQWVLVNEWAAANRINRIEWVLLWGRDWLDFVYSTERQQRLAQLVAVCKSFGVIPGADVPIAEHQQHAWFLVNDTTTDEAAFKSIHYHLSWLKVAGFSFISTENGFSEFTHGNDVRMLSWMNETARYADEELDHMKVLIKCHCSTGQTCKDYTDPDTGLPLNFNFLPIYADARMGIMPHTVQMYAFNDPAPTYGNQNFSYMFDFMFKNAAKGVREVVYHPETAYWVNYDVDVPLFLPLYGMARLRDLRHIASWQQSTGSSILGQMVFDSGWEYGYWLQDVVTARANWNPRIDLQNETDALHSILVDRVTGFLGPSDFANDLAVAIEQLIAAEHDLLVLGKVPGQPEPNSTVKVNGIGYLEGWDTWADFGALSSHALATQPLRLPLKEMFLIDRSPNYATQVRPLLKQMNTTFQAIADSFAALVPRASPRGKPFVAELADTTRVLANRAWQVFALYEGADIYAGTAAYRQSMLKSGYDIIATTAVLIQQREANFRVPVHRIAGWRQGPTVYTYGYVWSAHSLMYWYRDWAIASAMKLDVFNPCYLNVIDPADVALGEGLVLNATLIAAEVLAKLGYSDLGDCLSAPAVEPVYPKDL